MAHGSIAPVCAGRISLVPSLAVAVRAVGLGGAAHHLDNQHHPHLLCLASAHDWPAVGGSWLDYAAGIRIGGNRRCNYRVSLGYTNGGSVMLNAPGALSKCSCSSARHREHGRMGV